MTAASIQRFRNAEDLCVAVGLQDLAELPVYCVPSAELPADLGQPTFLGHTAPDLDLHLRPFIADGWLGRGVAMVLNEGRIREEAPSTFREALLGVAVHELSHALSESDWIPGLRRAPELQELAGQRALFGRRVDGERVSKYSQRLVAEVEMEMHGERFLRAALHLWHRARCRLAEIPLRWIWPQGRLTSRPWAYLECLREEWIDPHTLRPAWKFNELEDLAGLPIAGVLQTEAPTAFAELWEEDLASLDASFQKRKAMNREQQE